SRNGAPAARRTIGYPLGELARRFDLPLHGDPATVIRGVATLRDATPEELTFLANPRYRRDAADTRAGAIVVGAEDAPGMPCARLVADDPYAAFARIAALFEPAPAAVSPGTHPSAV